MASALRILIADDHDVVRDGIRHLLARRPEWEICAEAANGREAVRLAEKHRPDIVVLDLYMPELNGLEATRQIKRVSPGTEIVILTATENEELIHQLFAAGALSYIGKAEAGAHLLNAIETVARHKTYFTSSVSEVLFERFLRAGGKAAAPVEEGASRLTLREGEIVPLLVEGHSHKEIAEKLGISAKTVEGHRAAIMRKLKLESLTELVRWAIRHGLIEP